MGPQDPKDVARDTARDLSGLVGELAALKADATHWLTDATLSPLLSGAVAAAVRQPGCLAGLVGTIVEARC